MNYMNKVLIFMKFVDFMSDLLVLCSELRERTRINILVVENVCSNAIKRRNEGKAFVIYI